MHDLREIQDRNARAVVKEFGEAIQDGNLPYAVRILKANPDLTLTLLVEAMHWGGATMMFDVMEGSK